MSGRAQGLLVDFQAVVGDWAYSYRGENSGSMQVDSREGMGVVERRLLRE